MLADPAEAATRLGLFAGIDEGHLPRLGVTLMYLHGVLSHVERDVGHVEEVIRKVFLDDIPLKATADDKVRDPVGGVDFHHMPEERLTADLDHRLRSQYSLLTQPGSESSG